MGVPRTGTRPGRLGSYRTTSISGTGLQRLTERGLPPDFVPMFLTGRFPIDATLRRTLSATPNVELSLRDLPTQPATLGLDVVRQDALSLVRQLERRIADLPALAARVEAARIAAAEEAARAQHGLAQPFKHADALKAASARSTEIAIEMQNRQAPAPETATDRGTTDTASAAAEIDRLTRANFPTPVQGTPHGTAPASIRCTLATPGRDNDVSR